MACLGFAAWILWFLGYPDQALEKNREALTLARELSHPASSAYALDWAAMFHQFRREGQVAQERAEAAITLSTEQEVPFWLAFGTILQGWALAGQGQGGKGVAQMHEGMTGWRATRAELARPYFLALLADVYEKGGQAEEGLSALAEALETVEKNGERFYEAELHRLKGELTLQSSVQRLESSATNPQALIPNPQAEAEACFLKAIEIARQQQAKSLELRATVSLARLWQQREKTAEAQQMLAEIYGWFTEGFDTADLKEAKTLLEELSH